MAAVIARRRLGFVAALFSVAALAGTGLPATPAAPAPPEPPQAELHEQSLTASGTRVQPGWTRDLSASATTSDLVGIRWRGDGGAQFAVERRAGDSWEVVTQVGVNDNGPDPGTDEAARVARSEHLSEPVWVGDASGLRVRLVSGSASSVALAAVESPAGDDVPVSASLSATPKIISRVEWGADEGLRLRNCPGGPTYMDAVRLAVFHHTAGENAYSPADSYRIVRAIYVYATNVLGYCDIHYNFLVDKYGQIFEGRYGGVYWPVLGAHAVGFNSRTTGVALLGTYSTVSPTGASIEAVQQLLAWKLGMHGVDPTKPAVYTTAGNDKFAPGTTMAQPIVIGHRDTWFTDCPGQAAYNLLPVIRFSVAARMLTAGPDGYPPWTPGAGPRLVGMNEFGKLYPAGSQPDVTTPAYWRGFPIGRGVALLPGGAGGYELDGWGGLHRFGSAPAPTGAAYWAGWDIARDVELAPGGVGGYVLDGWGGIHPFGGAPALTGGPYFSGMDAARALVVLPGGTSGYVLDAWGAVHPVGGAPAVSGGPYWIGRDWARDLRPASDGNGLLLLDAFGGIWALGGATTPGAVPYFGYEFARALATVSGTPGGYVLDRSGRIHSFGGAPAVNQAQPNFVLARSLAAA